MACMPTLLAFAGLHALRISASANGRVAQSPTYNHSWLDVACLMAPASRMITVGQTT